MVPTTVAEGRKMSSSPEIELTETAMGATEEIFSSFSMVETSFKVRFDFRYMEEEVSSSTTRETAVLVVEGRTTIRSEPIWETCEETREEMLPIKESIKIIDATPIEMPRQVRKLRPRLRLIEARASS